MPDIPSLPGVEVFYLRSPPDHRSGPATSRRISPFRKSLGTSTIMLLDRFWRKRNLEYWMTFSYTFYEFAFNDLQRKVRGFRVEKTRIGENDFTAETQRTQRTQSFQGFFFSAFSASLR
jgi:hypothetical protein